MAHHELMVTLPTLALVGGYQIVLEAIDPTTGNIVAGSVEESIVIFASGDAGGDGPPIGLPIIEQTWLPVPPIGIEDVTSVGG